MPNAAAAAINKINENWSGIKTETYIACVSEYDDKEDLHGRLSM
jgi:hypothetical protein